MFNRRLLIDSGGEQQTYSVLEIHVDTPDGDHVRSARVELTYNGESNLANTDNKGIAVFYGVPTGTKISYTITAAGYNAATGKWIIPTDVEYETEYVVLSPLVNYNFKLTIGQNYDVEMGFYQSGFFKNDFGGINPAQFMQHTIKKSWNRRDNGYNDRYVYGKHVNSSVNRRYPEFYKSNNNLCG